MFYPVHIKSTLDSDSEHTSRIECTRVCTELQLSKVFILTSLLICGIAYNGINHPHID